MINSMILLQIGGDNPMVGMVFMVLMFAVMYFFMIRPQVTKQKEQNTFQSEIQKGMQVVTSSGMHGKIDKIEGENITLQVDTKTYLKFSKSAISKDLTEANYGDKK